VCLIVHRPTAGAHIPNAVIDSNLAYNDDGFGIAWREDGRLLYRKFGPADAGKFKTFLKKIDATDNEYMAHFRMATHGPKTQEMSHPYIYRDEQQGDVLFFHNGIIPIATPDDKSDTLVFVEEVISRLPSKWWENPALVYLVQNGIGYSRISLMTGEESVRMTGDNKWVFENGIYYSTQPTKTTYFAGGQYSRGADWSDENWYESYQRNFGKSDPKVPSGVSVAGSESKSGYYRPSRGTAEVGSSWTHVGHTVEATEDVVIEEGEAYGTAWCHQCDTLGEYYIIDSKVYIEMGHKMSDDDEEGSTDPKVFLLPEIASSAQTSKD